MPLVATSLSVTNSMGTRAWDSTATLQLVSAPVRSLNVGTPVRREGDPASLREPRLAQDQFLGDGLQHRIDLMMRTQGIPVHLGG